MTELQVLQRISWEEATVSLLEKIAAANWNDRLTVDDLLHEIRTGTISAWRIAGTESGLALLRVEQSPTRRVLILDGIAGHNVLTKGRAIRADLITIANVYDCATIETSAKDERWEHVAKRLGFAPVSIVYEMRIA